MNRRIAVVVLSVSSLAMMGITLADAHQSRPVEDSIRGYRKWTFINPKPFFIPEAVATQCRAALPGQLPPHGGKYIRVFVNKVGAPEFKSEHPQFPVGTVIVKEKLKEEKSKTSELMTIMVKREKGFNSESGDWEYAVTDGAGVQVEARGKIEKCQACHVQRKDTDYVFRGYLPAQVKSSH